MSARAELARQERADREQRNGHQTSEDSEFLRAVGASPNGAAPEDGNTLPPPSAPLEVARHLVRQYTHPSGALRRYHWRGQWWEWRTSHWIEVELGTVAKSCYEFTEHASYVNDKNETKPWRPTRHKVADLLAAKASVCHLPRDVDQPTWLTGDHGGVIVSCANGLLDVDRHQLLPHDPSFFNVVAVPFDYDPSAPAPERWLKFLVSLWPEDDEQIGALQEWFGYVISGRTELHKIMLLTGPTRAGKGVICRILTALVGGKNVAGSTLSSLRTNFGLQPLIGKPLAIVADARLDGQDSSAVVERLLSISGEDVLTIDVKYQPHWTGKLPSRIMICSNELPKFGDASGAIAGRFVILQLEHSWLGKEDPTLEPALKRELPGILNWALEGLARLEKDGRFTRPKAGEDALKQLQDLASPTGAFVRDCCDLGRDHRITVDDLWVAWRTWAEDNGHGKSTKQMLGKNLLAVDPRIKGRRNDDGRFYEGVALKKGST